MAQNPFSIEGRVVVVTGGLGQLGRQFTLALLAHGAKVAVFDWQVSERQIRARFPDFDSQPNLHFYNVDVTNRNSIEAAFESVVADWGVPSGLVNNAALDAPPDSDASENGPLEKYSAESFDKIVAVNVKGVLLCCQIIGGAMARAGRGAIINVSSIYGLVSPNQSIYEYRRTEGEQFYKPVAYSVSKSALYNLTRYLATYWAGKGVRVNTLTFAGVFNNQSVQFLAAYLPHVPLGRMAREDEYNGAVIFLLSDAASYMTGSNMVMDGGWTAW